jgi:hypothetical protein
VTYSSPRRGRTLFGILATLALALLCSLSTAAVALADGHRGARGEHCHHHHHWHHDDGDADDNPPGTGCVGGGSGNMDGGTISGGTQPPPADVAAPPSGGSSAPVPPSGFQAAIEGQAWQFSGFVGPNPQRFDLLQTDCAADIGIVLDPFHGMATFRIYGGLAVNCATPANVIAGDVAVQYCVFTTADQCQDASPNWFDVTARTTGTLANTTGSGDTLLVSPPVCKGDRTFFRVASQITIDTLTYTIASMPKEVPAGQGCTTGNEDV